MKFIAMLGATSVSLRVANLKKKFSATLSHVHDDFKEKKKKSTCGLTWNCCIVGYAAIACGILCMPPLFGVADGVNCEEGGTQAVPGIGGIEAPILKEKRHNRCNKHYHE